ncbi:MAG: hypothetical protein K8R36_25445 [Planctomycetales bacterium]|nr:hypothetical protein [Planctomycetales bacterium]
MVPESSPPQALRGRFTLGQVFLGIAAISVVLAAVYNFQEARESSRLRTVYKKLSQEVEDLKIEAELKQLENDLKAPAEALIANTLPARELAELRQQGFKKSRIDRFPQFASVYLNGAQDFDLPVKPDNSYCDPSSKYFGANGSYEQFWENHVPRACQRLTHELTQDKPLGRYLRENPNVFRKRLRPLLLRLVQADAVWIRSDACHALIVGGDRTDAVLDEIRSILSEPKHNVTTQGQKVVKQFSSEKQKWIELNRRYDLGLPVIEQEPVEEK